MDEGEGSRGRVNGREGQGLRPKPLPNAGRVIVSNERRAAAGDGALQTCMYRVQECRGKGVSRGWESSKAASYNAPSLIALAQTRERLSRYLYVMSHGRHMQTETPNGATFTQSCVDFDEVKQNHR